MESISWENEVKCITNKYFWPSLKKQVSDTIQEISTEQIIAIIAAAFT